MFDHFQFVYPQWFYAAPLLVLMALLRRRRGADGSIAHPTARLVAGLARSSESLAGRIGALLMVLSALLLVVALARPQWINEKDVREVSGVDIIIAFDLSGSMAELDMTLNGSIASRLAVAKAVIGKFIETRPDDRIGVVGFAGKTKSLAPLTLDHKILIQIIKATRVAENTNAASTIAEPGTAIGSAIAASSTRLEDREDTKSKVIILVTDGVSNVGELSPIEAATAAAKLGIRIYTIAVGTDGGGRNSRISGDMFDEETLKKISSMTGGEHFRASDTNKFLLAFSSIDKLEKTDVKVHTVKMEKELFLYALASSALLLLLGLAMQVLRPNPAP